MTPEAIAFATGTVGFFGIVLALKAAFAVLSERKVLTQAQESLVSSEAWESDEAFPVEGAKLNDWLGKMGIPSRSFVGDFIRTCWSAWLGGRSASLAELHALVARRERGRREVRVSAGIAATLLIIGIVGTLWCVHGILQNFSVPTTISGESAEVSEGAERVNSLVQELGGAFWPSLVALGFTILVVCSRGLYAMGIHRLSLDLDSFAVDVLIPRYRVASLAEQTHEVRDNLRQVIDRLLQREADFHSSAEKFHEAVREISPALKDLGTASATSLEAARSMTEQARTIADGFNRLLGEDSPMHRAVEGFILIQDASKRTANILNSVSEVLAKTNRESDEWLALIVDALKAIIAQSTDKHLESQRQTRMLVQEVATRLGDLGRGFGGADFAQVSNHLETIRKELQEGRKAASDQLATLSKDTTQSGSQLVLVLEAVREGNRKLEGLVEIRNLVVTHLRDSTQLSPRVPVVDKGGRDEKKDGNHPSATGAPQDEGTATTGEDWEPLVGVGQPHFPVTSDKDGDSFGRDVDTTGDPRLLQFGGARSPEDGAGVGSPGPGRQPSGSGQSAGRQLGGAQKPPGDSNVPEGPKSLLSKILPWNWRR